jgi:hypothetical protein
VTILTLKQHEPPKLLLQLDALLKRILHHHHRIQEIESTYNRILAGFKGELSLDYYLSSLPEKEFIILHDIRLKIGSYFFQIDTLILHSSFILVIEVKNISGEIYLDSSFSQMIRTIDGHTEIFPDPILQANKQMTELKRWLIENKFSEVPIEHIVVFTNPKALIKAPATAPDINKRLIRNTKLAVKILEYSNVHTKKVLTDKNLTKLSRKLIKHHVPPNQDVLELFGLSEHDIQTGIYCKSCNSFSMERVSGRWRCRFCRQTNKNAHIEALAEYSLLFKPSITNSEMRKFLNLTSANIAVKLLSQMNLPATGKTKSKQYLLPPDLVVYKATHLLYK